MDKSCANHPESMALATCKACEKSVCLMCVVDEKEGTFCSAACHTAFANGEQVPKFVGAAAESGSAGGSSGGVQKIESIFDDPPAPTSERLNAPPSDEPEPIVAEGTKWRAIGAPCDNHTDTPAVANCDRCGKPICALCLLEAAQGTFCSNECLGTAAKQPVAVAASAERAALQGKPVFKFREPPKEYKGLKVFVLVLLLIALGWGGYYGYNAFLRDVNLGSLLPNGHETPSVTPPDNTLPDPTTTEASKPETATTPDPNKPETNPDRSKPETVDTTPFVPRKPFPKPEKIVPTRYLTPWAGEEPGAWYRIRQVKGGQVTYTDFGLKSKTEDSWVVLTQTCANGKASAVTETKTAPETVYLRGEESFEFEGNTYLCEIRSPGREENSPRIWSLISGKHMGAVFKETSPQTTVTPTKAWEHTLRIKNQSYDCLVVETEVKTGNATRQVKSWYTGSVPMVLIQQQENGESTLNLVDQGDDWSKRPNFP